MQNAGRIRGGRITRWLRFRLTLSYVIFVALLLAGVGLFFRGALNSIQDEQVSAILEEEWGALRGYLKIEKQKTGGFKPDWNFDREDPEEALIVERLRSVFLIADATGHVMEVSDTYKDIGIDSPESIREQIGANRVLVIIRANSDGEPFMIRSGVVIDEKKPFFVAIGRSLSENKAILKRFTTYYVALLPLMILGCTLLGWFVSKRALRPVTELAARTEAISGSNLSLRIPQRGAGDELDHLIATFNNMVGRLEKSFIQTRQFSTDVSHELRTPLTVIRGQLEVALLTATTEDQYRDAIMAALQDVERLSNTVRALLHLAQAEGGQLTLQRTEFDLRRVVDDLADQFRLLADAGQLHFSVEMLESCPISGDRVQIERLVSNLLSNAIKYTPAEGYVRVKVKREGGNAVLAVSDTGRGIPSEALPHIFDRFYRVPGHRRDPETGLGLGLSFVSWIVRAHDGTIDVKSESGKGTTFTVKLPSVRHDGVTPELKEAYGV